MLVAAVDTATLTLSCALVDLRADGARLLTQRTERAPVRSGGPPAGHGIRLPGALVELLEAAGRRLAEVEGFAIGLGPGSFTGLRIGLATWKGLAYACRRPIAGASSLAAMALAAAGSVPEGALLVPVLDAKKGEVYAGFYRARGGAVELVAPEAAIRPEPLGERIAALERPAAGVFSFGEGIGAHGGILDAALPALVSAPLTPPALEVARLAAPQLLGAAFDSAALFALEPHYVRPSEAELKYPRGLGPGAEG